MGSINRSTIMSTWLSKLSRLVASTSIKLAREDEDDDGFGPMSQEYANLEHVGPAPGRPWDQHDTMVRQGLCQAAVKHKEENRYCNLFPFDANRVVLEGDNDYINASWVVLPGVRDRLILTMGPIHPDSYSRNKRTDWDSEKGANTCPQMWTMIAQEEVPLVVMLCAVQDGFTGCSQYFPSSLGEEQVHRGWKVVSKGKEEKDKGIIVRELEFVGDNKSFIHKVTHMQFTMWPNYGVVENVEQLADLVRTVYKEARKQEGKPVVIHCSGGVGRSGTFTTIYSLYSLLIHAKRSEDWQGGDKLVGKVGELVLEPLVRMLRGIRHPWMVEGEAQYRLAYQGCMDIMKGLLES